MSTALAVQEKLDMSRALAVSNLLPQAYRGNPGNLLYALEYAEALQVPPMTAITGIHVIEGKPSASAQLIAGLVRRAGHRLRVTFKDGVARAVIIRADDPEFEYVSEWDMKRAEAANLTGKKVWKQYPDAMLKARAITEVARDAASEALFGVIYTAEELGADNTDEDGAATHATTVTVERPKKATPKTEPAWTVPEMSDANEARGHYRDRLAAGASKDELAAIAAEGKRLTELEAAAPVDAELVEDAATEASVWQIGDDPFDDPNPPVVHGDPFVGAA